MQQPRALSLFWLAFAFVVPAGAQGDNNGQWNRLCDIVDCSQYPYGYDSVILSPPNSGPKISNEPDFYFPVAEDFPLHPNWVEYGSGGNRTRSITLRDNVSGIGWRFMPDALQRSGTIKDWPSELNSNFTLTIFRNDASSPRSWSGDWRIALKVQGYSEDEIRQVLSRLATLPDSDADELTYDSLSENFWLVYQLTDGDLSVGKKSESPQWHFGAFSKEPMLQGMHILGLCNQTSCFFYTVPKKGEKSRYLYSVSWHFGKDGSRETPKEFPNRHLERGFALLSRVIDERRRIPDR
jgi:hypothetical protein